MRSHVELKQFGESMTAGLDINSFQLKTKYEESNVLHLISTRRCGGDVSGFLDETELQNELFVRSFYDLLLKKILNSFDKFLNVLLLGNPGIGKSTFQAYVLYCLIRARDDPTLAFKPEVIIRQVSIQQPAFEVYVMRSGDVYTAKDLSVTAEYEARGKILRLYEPDTDESPPPTTKNVLTLSSLSLYPPRVKEVKKKSTRTLYMPVWTKPELVALGRYYHRMRYSICIAVKRGQGE